MADLPAARRENRQGFAFLAGLRIESTSGRDNVPAPFGQGKNVAIMNTNASTLLPEGFRDRLPPFALAASQVTRTLLDTLASHGYERVDPPLAEFEDSLRAQMNGADSRNLLRFVDPISQHSMAIRPDMTMQIGRIAMTSMARHPRPLRLSYAGPVLRLRSTQLRPERGRQQIGAELIGSDSVAAVSEIVSVAVEALRSAGLTDITVDFTLPDLIACLSNGPLPLPESVHEDVVRELDMKDAGGLVALGAEAYLPLIEATGPFDSAMERLRTFDQTGILQSRLDGMAHVAASIDDQVQITLDPTERHGFEYQSWIGFTFYARGFAHALGRGGSYQICGDGETEAAVGFSFYPDPLIDSGLGAADQRRVFLPKACDQSMAARLRAEGWVTIAALDDENSGLRQGCTHWLDGARLVAY